MARFASTVVEAVLRTDHYVWLSQYLGYRGLALRVRMMTSAVATSTGVGLLVLLYSSDGPAAAVGIAMMWISVAGAAVGSILWAWRWPTCAQSMLVAVASTGSIALVSLAQPSPWPGLIGCIAFVLSGAYCAFFHSASLVVLNAATATAIGSVASIAIAASGHAVVAVLGLFLVIQVNIAMPWAVYLLVRAAGFDLLQADRDPLTGLLNRRAFHRHARQLVRDGSALTGASLTLILVDLDKFKVVNDTLGHAAGDELLVAVARVLRQAVDASGAVVGRIGGEEFVVADVSVSTDSNATAHRICNAIAALPNGITASAGVVCWPLGSRPDGREADDLDLYALIEAADSAMYCAKRAGGNRFHLYEDRDATKAAKSRIRDPRG